MEMEYLSQFIQRVALSASRDLKEEHYHMLHSEGILIEVIVIPEVILKPKENSSDWELKVFCPHCNEELLGTAKECMKILKETVTGE